MFRDTRSRIAAILAVAACAMFVFSGAASAAPPANDDWTNAIALDGWDITESGANHEATNEVDEPQTDGILREMSVWYSWVSPVDGDVLIDTCGTDTSDLFLGVFDGYSVDSLNQVAAADDGCADAGPSSVTFVASQGVTYSINVALAASDPSSDFSLSIKTSPVMIDAPTIGGNEIIGQQLTGNDGDWGGITPVSYSRQWQRCDEYNSVCDPIDGETGTTYTPVEADRGHVLRYELTAGNAIGNSAPVAPSTSVIDSDVDGDGAFDSYDNCPNDVNPGQDDYDIDSYGDACDDDDDEDGEPDATDEFPRDVSEQYDYDDDGVGDNADGDDDGDGISDDQEAIDGTDPHDEDSDGDGKTDDADVCPLVFAAGADGCPIPFVPVAPVPVPPAAPAPPAPPLNQIVFNTPSGNAGSATAGKNGVVTVPKTTLSNSGGAASAAYAATGRFMAMVATKKGKRKKLTLIASASLTVKPGETLPVSLKLTRQGMAVLRRVKRMSGKISLVARLADGTTKTAEVSFTITAPKA